MIRYWMFNNLCRNANPDSIVNIKLETDIIHFKLNNVKYSNIGGYEIDCLLIEDIETFNTYLISLDKVQYVKIELTEDLKREIKQKQFKHMREVEQIEMEV